MTGIHDEGTHDCNLGYYDTFDLLITLKKRRKKRKKAEGLVLQIENGWLQNVGRRRNLVSHTFNT